MRPIVLSAHERPITCVKINRDGDLLFTSSKDNRLMLWFVKNGERIGTYDGHNGAVYDCDVDLYSKYLLSASADASCKLWEVETGKCLATYKFDGDFAMRRNIAWAYDNKTFMYSTARYKDAKCKIIIQEVGEDPSQVLPPKLIIPDITEYTVTDAKWGPLNKTVVCVAEDGFIREFSVAGDTAGQLLRKLNHCENSTNTEIQCIEYSHDKCSMIVCGRDKKIKVYDSKTFKCLKEFTAAKPLNAVALHPTLPIIMACGGEKAIDVALTAADKGQFEVQFFHLIYKDMVGEVNTGHYSPLNVLTFYPDGDGFVTGADEGNCRLFRFDANFTSKFTAAFGQT